MFSPDQAVPWECMGRKQSLPEPGECNWPYCGCDEHATKVIEALIEQGWTPPNIQPVRTQDAAPDVKITNQNKILTGWQKACLQIDTVSALKNTDCK
jgi:hypothetical protein